MVGPLQGLRKIRETGQSIGVPIRVFGPETHITAVVPMALGLVDGSKMPEFDEVDEKVRSPHPIFVIAWWQQIKRLPQGLPPK